MSDRKQLYIGVIHDRANAETGIGVFAMSGYLSPCGKYVEQYSDFAGKTQAVRHPVDHHWQDTPAKALAVLAGRVRKIGERLLRQAEELEAGA